MYILLQQKYDIEFSWENIISISNFPPEDKNLPGNFLSMDENQEGIFTQQGDTGELHFQQGN